MLETIVRYHESAREQRSSIIIEHVVGITITVEFNEYNLPHGIFVTITDNEDAYYSRADPDHYQAFSKIPNESLDLIQKTLEAVKNRKQILLFHNTRKEVSYNSDLESRIFNLIDTLSKRLGLQIVTE